MNKTLTWIIVAVLVFSSNSNFHNYTKSQDNIEDNSAIKDEVQNIINIPLEPNKISLDATLSHEEYINKKAEEFKNSVDLSSYTNISSLLILDETAFLNFASLYSSLGDGSKGNPFIFSNLQINASLVKMQFSTVTSYFIIKNSVVHSGMLEIISSNIMNITSNLLYSQNEVLSMEYVSNVNITKNIIISNSSYYAVQLRAVTKARVSDNKILEQ